VQSACIKQQENYCQSENPLQWFSYSPVDVGVYVGGAQPGEMLYRLA